MEKLLKANEKVWFYLNESDKQEFVKEVNDLGITFNNGKSLNVNNCGFLMAISNRKLAYVSGFVWNASFQTNQLNPIRIHYRNYKNNQDYELIKPNFFYFMIEN